MQRRPFLLLSLLILFAATVQASVSALSPASAASDRGAPECSMCGPIGGVCTPQ